jgi:Arc/MetJ-type ribon-helix-helix transcriptional regulator
MSKGTQRYTFRLPEQLLNDVQEQIVGRNDRSADTPWTLSDFVRIALQEKLDKMSRSRRGSRKFPAGPVSAWTSGDSGKLTVPGTDQED